MYKYTDALQITMVIFTILLVGAIFGFIKFFREDEMKRVRRLLWMIPVATTMFYEISRSPFNKDTWMVFLHGIIIEAILHIIAYAYAAIYHPKQTIMEKFIPTVITLTESDFFWYGFPFAQVLFDDSYICYSVIVTFVQTLCVHSIHMILVLRFIPDAVEKFKAANDPTPEEEVPLGPKQHTDKEDDGNEDNMELHDIKQNEENENQTDEQSNVSEKKSEEPSKKEEAEAKKDDEEKSQKEEEKSKDENKNSEESQGENKDDKEQSSSTPEINVEHGKDDHPADVPQEEEKPVNKWYYRQWLIEMYAFVNQHNLCAIAGLFWSLGVSFTHVKMPSFLIMFTYDLEKASVCAGLFSAGIFIAFHPFKGAPVVDVIAACVNHFIIKPLLAIAFGYALGLPHSIAKFLVFVYIAPVGSYGYMLSDQAGWKTSMVTYSMYWTMICVLPVYLIWAAIINATHMFE